ncbi:MAG: thioesterase, partial [Novosphingobium meiothermophilum]
QRSRIPLSSLEGYNAGLRRALA